MKHYCKYCFHNDEEMCQLFCDSYNKMYYRFSWQRWIIVQFEFTWMDITIWFNLNFDKNWWKHWKNLL